jgi:Uma2 family endonuclease
MALPKAEAEKLHQRLAQASEAAARTWIPPLESGDRLTREEFERRYEAMPHVKKAELIEGVVYMPSPMRFDVHSEQQSQITTWLGVYRASTPGVRTGGDATVCLDYINEPQPDGVLVIDRSAGGQTFINEKRYLEGPPELVVEVSASTESYDLHGKLEAYRRNGVKEYIVHRVYDHEINWYRLRAGKYVLVKPRQGVIRSRVFPGLHLDVAALLAGDLAKVLAVLQTGLESKEHADFVKKLSGKQEASRRKSDPARAPRAKKKSR